MSKCTLILCTILAKRFGTLLFFLVSFCMEFVTVNSHLQIRPYQAFSLPGTGFEVYNLLACEAQPYFR